MPSSAAGEIEVPPSAAVPAPAPVRVAVVPPWPSLDANRLLTPGDHSTVSDAFAAWRALAAAEGFAVDTSDLCPPEQADLLWFVDLPRMRRDFDRIVAAARPGCRVVLHVLESPAYAPAGHDRRNHARADLVLTYDRGLAAAGGRYRFCRIPWKRPPAPPAGPDFASRRLAVMINTNKAVGWSERRGIGTGWASLPGIGRALTGWSAPASTWFNPGRGELFSWRRRLARAAEREPHRRLDIYGRNWNGHPIHWWPRPRPRGYRCAVEAPGNRGFPDAMTGFSAKFALMAGYRFAIATENFRGDCGYISEKALDALGSGTVPVYLGDERIAEVLPRQAFIDAREFPRPRQLLDHLAGMSEARWLAHREAGEAWLASEASREFSSAAFASTALQALRDLRPSPANPS